MASDWNTLITSGAYVGEEMQAEFGRIPPAFLPIGAAFLVQHQLREAKGRQSIWLSLPNDYAMTASQERLLDDTGVRVFRAEPRKSLGLSVFQAVLEIEPDRPIEIIHGDTLVLDPALPETDAVSVSKVTEQYKWGLVEASEGQVRGVKDADRSDTISSEALILSGYFAIREPWRLLKCLVARDFSFTGALDTYAAEVPVTVNDGVMTLDCGHLKTFYDSRRSLAAARHFNSIGIEGGVVRKRSRDRRKIDAEANWLRSVPADLQPFTARLIEDPGAPSSGEYRTLYCSYPTLAELYLARTPQVVWHKILNSCLDYLGKAAAHAVPERETYFKWLVIGKLRERMAQYPEFLPKPDVLLKINGQQVGTLEDIVAQLAEIVAHAPRRAACVMHGDFCFSNMLYDLRSDRIQLIDPRGLVGDEMTIYGDLRYDIAKLGHSILGRYDQILGERLRAGGTAAEVTFDIPPDPDREWLEDSFLNARVSGQCCDAPEVKAAMVSLFLSMIPLHADAPDRQRALFANGLRLFERFFEPR
ncbi:phosphotransferase [Roseovarius amoyensis]|uniref:phosphotransferase n=1 Tax=Roseovarius amoyensis TaxID=2211448 RepID=UPI000DBE1564|nr:phosphotransferase [Roseovarius amoyensis]